MITATGETWQLEPGLDFQIKAVPAPRWAELHCSICPAPGRGWAGMESFRVNYCRIFIMLSPAEQRRGVHIAHIPSTINSGADFYRGLASGNVLEEYLLKLN